MADPSARAGIDAAAALPPDRRRPGAARSFAGFARRRPSFLIGLAIVAVTIFLAVFGPLVAPHPPERALPGAGLLPPSLDHWLGTDVAGMDIFSRVISAPRIDLTIALISSLIAFVFGVSLGVVSGFFAGAAGPGRPISELTRDLRKIEANCVREGLRNSPPQPGSGGRKREFAGEKLNREGRRASLAP